jgi:cytochrome c-type biogenesis protein CcmH/NrfF
VRAVAVVALTALVFAAGAGACLHPASQADLETKLVCIECHTTLDQSNSPFAVEMKREIAQQIRECRTEKQIIDSMVAQFGTTVLSTPQTHGFDLLAWVLPLGGVGIGAVALGFGAWRWSSVRGRRPQQAELAPEDVRLVDEELARFDG